MDADDFVSVSTLFHIGYFFSEVAFIIKKNCKVSRVQVLKYVYHLAHLHRGLRKSSFSLSELKLQQDEILSKDVLIFSYGRMLLGNQMET